MQSQTTLPYLMYAFVMLYLCAWVLRHVGKDEGGREMRVDHLSISQSHASLLLGYASKGSGCERAQYIDTVNLAGVLRV